MSGGRVVILRRGLIPLTQSDRKPARYCERCAGAPLSVRDKSAHPTPLSRPPPRAYMGNAIQEDMSP